MCGIGGIVTRNSETAESTAQRLRALLDALRHRGPDDLAWVAGNRSALGMTRLAIVGIENGSQPFISEDGKYAAVGNGEIYNAAELRDELRGRGHRIRSDSDIEVALHLFEESGTDSFARLQGMFALAILDLATPRLWIARDRIGIKPLFYAETADGFQFASELPALRAALSRAGEAAFAIDRSALGEFLRFGYVPAPLTIHSGIRRLAPGEWARFDARGLTVERWWQWPDPGSAPAPAFPARSAEDWSQELESLLGETVRRHTMGDVPAGAFLSGGLDSGTIVAQLSQTARRPVPVFTIAFDDPDLDEIEAAARTARAFGCEHHVEVLPRVEMHEIDQLFSAYGEPFGDVSLLPTFWVSRLARRHVKFVLSGDGGDEMFAGYAWLKREIAMRRLPKPLLKMARAFSPLLVPGQRSVRRDFLGKALRSLGDLASDPLRSFLRRRSLTPPHLTDLLVHRALRGSAAEHEPTAQEQFALRWRGGPLELLLELDRRFYLANDILEKVDRATMMNSLEARVPFLDHRVVELASRIPLDLHLGEHGTGKAILRRVAGRLLPREVLAGKKRGFGIPVDRWLREELFEETRDRLLDRSLREAEVLDQRLVETLLCEHRTNVANHGHLLWGLLSLAAWIRSGQTGGVREASELPAEAQRSHAPAADALL